MYLYLCVTTQRYVNSFSFSPLWPAHVCCCFSPSTVTPYSAWPCDADAVLAVRFGWGFFCLFFLNHLFLEITPWALHLTKASGLHLDSNGTFVILTISFAKHIFNAFSMNSSHFVDCSCRILLQNFNYKPSNYDISLNYYVLTYNLNVP